MTTGQIIALESRKAHAGLHPRRCPCSFCREIRRGLVREREHARLHERYVVAAVTTFRIHPMRARAAR